MAGYIGGSVLARLIAHKSASTFAITVLVRDPVKAKKFETFDVKSVVGSFDDLDKISSLAEQAHIVFQCVSFFLNFCNTYAYLTLNCLIQADAADNEPVAKAVLDGLHKRHGTIGDLPILIHTVSRNTDNRMTTILTMYSSPEQVCCVDISMSNC